MYKLTNQYLTRQDLRPDEQYRGMYPGMDPWKTTELDGLSGFWDFLKGGTATKWLEIEDGKYVQKYGPRVGQGWLAKIFGAIGGGIGKGVGWFWDSASKGWKTGSTSGGAPSWASTPPPDAPAKPTTDPYNYLTAGQLIPGMSNTTLMVLGGLGTVALFMMMKKRGGQQQTPIIIQR